MHNDCVRFSSSNETRGLQTLPSIIDDVYWFNHIERKNCANLRNKSSLCGIDHAGIAMAKVFYRFLRSCYSARNKRTSLIRSRRAPSPVIIVGSLFLQSIYICDDFHYTAMSKMNYLRHRTCNRIEDITIPDFSN